MLEKPGGRSATLIFHRHIVRHAYAPGRINLIGDHTDYNAGLALPMAIDLGTWTTYSSNPSDRLLCISSADPSPIEIPIDLAFDATSLSHLQPRWSRLAAAIAALGNSRNGGVVRSTTTLAMDAGLSSSAAFAVSFAMALGIDIPAIPLAKLCQRSEIAIGSNVGLMDPLVSIVAKSGSAVLINFNDISYEDVAIPEGVDVVAVHSGVSRTIGSTSYMARRAECDAATLALGRPVGLAEEADIPGVIDPLLRRRVRHVVTECIRVKAFVQALRDKDLVSAGRLMSDSHTSLRDDFESSTPVVDSLVAKLQDTPGVYGARMTGGGFGGYVVALCEKDALDPATFGHGARKVVPSQGASVITNTSLLDNESDESDEIKSNGTDKNKADVTSKANNSYGMSLSDHLD